MYSPSSHEFKCDFDAPERIELKEIIVSALYKNDTAGEETDNGTEHDPDGPETSHASQNTNSSNWSRRGKLTWIILSILSAGVCFATPLVGGYCIVRSLHLKYAFLLSDRTPRLQWHEYRVLYQWIVSFGVLSGFFIPGLSILVYLKKHGDWSLPILIPVIFDFVKIRQVSKRVTGQTPKNDRRKPDHWWCISKTFFVRENWKRVLALCVCWGLTWVLIIAFLSQFTSVGIVSLERVSQTRCPKKLSLTWDCFDVVTKAGISNCSGLKDWIVCVRLGDVTFDPEKGLLKGAGVATGLLVLLRTLISVAFQLLGALSDGGDKKRNMPGVITVIFGLLLFVFWVIVEAADCSDVYDFPFMFKIQLYYLGFTVFSIGILIFVSDINVHVQDKQTDPEQQTDGRAKTECPRMAIACFASLGAVGLVLPMVNWMIPLAVDCH